MASYKPVRSSSPLGDREDHGEAHELDEDIQRPDADKEQGERLLSEQDEEEPDHYEPKSRVETRRLWLVGALVLLAITVLVGVSFLLRIFIRTRSPAPTPASARTTSDYVLSQDWDYGAPPMVREYNWVIQDVVANPDGVFRPMIVINGKFPGEMIRCNEGDTIVVNVENQSVNSTSIHWHGIFQNGTNWMDGTPGVTQCPIAPGRKFRYVFTIKGQSGTYFYHGHHAAQALDGLVGPIVVHARDERTTHPVPYDSDRVVMLQDWYYELSSALLIEKLSPGSESSPVPNGALINGVSKADCSLHPSRRCDASAISLATFNLEPDKNHRLRLINAGAFAWFQVSADSHHNVPVTEVDGTTVEPSPQNNVLIGPGQRYSMVLTANQTGADAFWFRARMVKHCFSENVIPEHGFDEVKAILRYTSADSAQDDTEPTLPTTSNDSGNYAVECRDPKVGTFKPSPAAPAPAYAHHSWHTRVNLEIGAWRLERGFLNQSTYRANISSPTLHRVVDGLTSLDESFFVEGVNSKAFATEHELVISNKGIEVVDIILQNFDEGNHPFHLHGQQFYILASGHAYFPGYEALGLAPEGKGLLDPANSTIIDNPLRRDVATVEGFGWLLLRFVADNPGLWQFHCHMIWHGESGMAMQFLSRWDMLQAWTIPEENRMLCEEGADELEKGAAPHDSVFYGTPG